MSEKKIVPPTMSMLENFTIENGIDVFNGLNSTSNVSISLSNTSVPESTYPYSENMTQTPATNSSLNQPPPLVVQLGAILVPIFFGLIICVGIVGNSLVITVLTKIYRARGQGLNNTNRFILNLAVSDLLFLIFCVPFHTTVYTLPGWPFGGFMCVFTLICQELSMIASVYSLVALSVDRFLAVVFATSAKQFRTRTNAIRGMIFIWIAAIGIATPSVFTKIYMEFQGIGICLSSQLKWTKWYVLCLFLLGYLLPLLIIIGCYVGLLMVMCKSARNSSVAMNNNSVGEARKRVARIVILVVIVFAICWFPHHLFTLWMHFGHFEFNNATLWLRLISHCMAYANSCLNPLIYGFVSKKFRDDFKKAFTCQYLSEAVFNVKTFSQNMLVSIGGTIREVGTSTRRRGAGVPRTPVSMETVPEGRSGAAGGVARAIHNKNKTFRPRSPLMYTPIPKELDQSHILEENEKQPLNKVEDLQTTQLLNDSANAGIRNTLDSNDVMNCVENENQELVKKGSSNLAYPTQETNF